MAHSPHISLIFVNYQSAWSLSLALKSLFSIEREKDLFEVIVINNDPKERHVLLHLAHFFPIQLIESDKNTGFGQGVNTAAAQATGHILGLLNPDIIWQTPSLARIRDFFLKRTAPIILGFSLVNEHGKEEAWSGGRAPSLALLLWNNIFQKFFLDDRKNDETLDWISGCGLFLSRELFQNLDGFDKSFFLYFEDVDLCLRAKKQGASIVRDKRFALMHRGGKSFSSRSGQKNNFYRSQSVYFKKHRPRIEFLVVRFLHGIFRGL